MDYESYDNIQKQLLQAESTNLRPNSDPIPVMKMRPIKDAPLVDSRYKTLALQKDQYPIFSDIDQYSFILEGKSKEVTRLPVSTSSISEVSGSIKEQPSHTTKYIVYGDKGTEPVKVSGGDKTIVTTEGRSITCTKTITKKIIHGPGGPREEFSETMNGEECQKLEELKKQGKGELDADGTYTVRVTGSGSAGGINIPSLEDFLSGKQVSGSSFSTGSSTSKTQSSSSKTQSGFNFDDEFDDFSHADLGPPSFTPIKTQGSSGSTTYTKTVVSGSSGTTKEGTEWGTKYKSGPVFEDLGPIQVEHSEEDTPDLNARSVQSGGVKRTSSHTGKGK